jgi:hypothetical protein
MAIRAKMKVTKKESDPNSSGQFILGLEAVTSGSPENDSFFRYTPGASLNMHTVNEAVAAQLEVGQECYLDITPIPADGVQAANEDDGEEDARAGDALGELDEAPPETP